MKGHDISEIDHFALLEKFRATYPPRVARIEGVAWEYIVAGSGRQTILLLPGAMGVAETSFHSMLAFAKQYRLLSLSYPPVVKSLHGLMDGLVAVLDSWQIECASLVGGSYSGPIVHAFAQLYPKRVDRLIFSNTGIPSAARLRQFQRMQGVLKIVPTPLLHWSMQRSVARFQPEATPIAIFWRDYFAHLIPTFSREALVNRMGIMIDLVKQLQAEPSGTSPATPPVTLWQGPTLIVEACDDDFFTVGERAALCARYPQAEVVGLAGKGHGSALNDIDAHIAVYQSFLQQA